MRSLGPQAMGAYASLRSRIIAGEWPSGSRLPSQNTLAALLGVAPLTLRQALDRLEAEGMISRQSRRGTFVRHTSADPVPGLDEMFDLMFKHAPIGISFLNTAGCLLKSNPALQSLLGYTADELEGKIIPHYTHPEDVARHVEVMSTAIRDGRHSYEIVKRYIRKDGSTIRCRLMVYSIMLGGEEVGALGMVEPIPEQATPSCAL